MKKLYYLPFFLIFIMCSSPKFEYREFKYSMSKSSTDKFVNSLEANDSIYSLLFFTDGFLSNEMLEVKNDTEIIFSDTLVAERVFGHAKTIRIKNQMDVIITDMKSNYSFNFLLSRTENINTYMYQKLLKALKTTL